MGRVKGALEKLLAVFIALLLWNYITSQGNVEVTYVVPIEYRNMPSDFEIVGDFPSFVTVRLRGSAPILRNLNVQGIKVWVDLKEAKEGKNRIKITNINVPEGIKVVKVVPSMIVLKFEKIISKSLLVKVRWKKEPHFDWKVIPAVVEARGRKSILKKMKFVPTTEVDPKLLLEKKTLEVKIQAPAAITVTPEIVRVEVTTDGEAVRHRRDKGEG